MERAAPPGYLAPTLLRPGLPPDDQRVTWALELKWDGMRAQLKMLDHTLRRADERGITNLTATRGDARDLYADESFDAAFLVAVLGEIADQDAALRELARVLRPGGRLVTGELFGDPHWVSPRRLRERAGRAGLEFDERLGSPLGYFARFRR